jgi:acyl-CoA synthetase (AMP-forming)/AMP-acid ligase II
MGFGDNFMLKLDETVTGVLGEWDIYSTSIISIIFVFFTYHIFTRRDPDAHPMLLARQAQASAVRNQRESAVYRSHSSPHGMALNSGLNVKDPGTSKWSRGRDGDLRDVWRRVITGPTDQEGNPTNEKGRILTVLGSEQILEHNLDDITRQINLIGQHIKQDGGSSVAIYLPNSIEFLSTLFACAFYDLTPILLPFDQSSETIISMLQRSNADTMVAAVGSLSFDAVAKGYPALRQLIWVVDEGNKHMDWNEVPKGTGGVINVSTWQDIIQDQELTVGMQLPALKSNDELKNIIAFWPTGDLIEHTHKNMVAAIAAQLSSIPSSQRISPSDLFLPTDSLSTIYPLVLTLSALYCNASVALNSVAGRSQNLVLATQGVAPTIIVASATTLSNTHAETAGKLTSPFYRAVHWSQTRTLTQNGVMPLASMFSRFNDSLRPTIGTKPGKLRLVFVSEQSGADSTPLSATNLSDLRIFTGARVVYALTAAKVAGAVTQTGIYDYRVEESASGKCSHFGAPVSSVEVFLRDTKEHMTTDDIAVGEVVARGPAVVGGEAAFGVVGTIKDDHTLAYV